MEIEEVIGSNQGSENRTYLLPLDTGNNVDVEVEVEDSDDFCKENPFRQCLYCLAIICRESQSRFRAFCTDEHAIAFRDGSTASIDSMEQRVVFFSAQCKELGEQLHSMCAQQCRFQLAPETMHYLYTEYQFIILGLCHTAKLYVNLFESTRRLQSLYEPSRFFDMIQSVLPDEWESIDDYCTAAAFLLHRTFVGIADMKKKIDNLIDSPMKSINELFKPPVDKNSFDKSIHNYIKIYHKIDLTLLVPELAGYSDLDPNKTDIIYNRASTYINSHFTDDDNDAQGFDIEKRRLEDQIPMNYQEKIAEDLQKKIAEDLQKKIDEDLQQFSTSDLVEPDFTEKSPHYTSQRSTDEDSGPFEFTLPGEGSEEITIVINNPDRSAYEPSYFDQNTMPRKKKKKRLALSDSS